MYRSLQLVGLGLIALGCGSPGELDASQFPDDYAGEIGGGVAGAQSGIAGTGGGAPVAGAGGAGVPVPVGGAGGAAPVGGSGGSGVVGGAGGGVPSQGGAGSEPGGCPPDIGVLLNRPGPEGGC